MTAVEPMGDWGTDANSAIKLAQVLPSAPDDNYNTFQPAYTYQLYGENEQIFGYKGLSVQIKFASDDMTPLLKVGWKEKVKEVGDVAADDPAEPLLEHLPEDVCRTEEEFKKRLESRTTTFVPPGEVLQTYEKNGRTFEIWKTPFTDEATKELLGNIQVLVSLFIEGGTPIPLDEEEWAGKRWEIFFLYERRADSQYIFIGYATCHHFYFFDKKVPNLSRTRISQVIVLPPFQREGHGAHLYDEIFTHYHAQSTVQEITVEDPSEPFEDLRITRDIARLKANGLFNGVQIQDITEGKIDVEKLRKENKLPERQFATCLEIVLLEMLNPNDKLTEARYRLWVKTRIYKQHKDVLMQLDKSERIEKLDDTYHNLMDDYKRILKAMKSRKANDEQEKTGRPAKRVKVA